MTWITIPDFGGLEFSTGPIACEKFHKLLPFAPKRGTEPGEGMTEPGPSGGRPGPRDASKPASGAEYAGAGLQLAMTLVAFMFLGIWLDKRLGSSPWFVLICVFTGAGAGFYSIYRRLMGSAKGNASGRGGKRQ
jgi:putative F0F1-ATPase subunit (Ca2+/Mg2+ transporter)